MKIFCLESDRPMYNKKTYVTWMSLKLNNFTRNRCRLTQRSFIVTIDLYWTCILNLPFAVETTKIRPSLWDFQSFCCFRSKCWTRPTTGFKIWRRCGSDSEEYFLSINIWSKRKKEISQSTKIQSSRKSDKLVAF